MLNAAAGSLFLPDLQTNKTYTRFEFIVVAGGRQHKTNWVFRYDKMKERIINLEIVAMRIIKQYVEVELFFGFILFSF